MNERLRALDHLVDAIADLEEREKWERDVQRARELAKASEHMIRARNILIEQERKQQLILREVC